MSTERSPRSCISMYTWQRIALNETGSKITHEPLFGILVLLKNSFPANRWVAFDTERELPLRARIPFVAERVPTFLYRLATFIPT